MPKPLTVAQGYGIMIKLKGVQNMLFNNYREAAIMFFTAFGILHRCIYIGVLGFILKEGIKNELFPRNRR